jgi:hypothetical protein
VAGHEDTEQQLIELEWALWRAETRFDAEFMERTLAPDFAEFGRSGRVYARADTLAVGGDSIDAKLRDFQFAMLAEDVALLTYISEVQHEQLDIANRSSVWVRRDGRWQLRFHQGTPAG